MKRLLLSCALACALMIGGAQNVHAQSRADTAAVLIDAAEQLRLRGETGAARALLDLVARQYAGTPAAAEVERMRALLRRTPDAERSGRTELMVFGTTYGAWLGIALPLAADATSPTAYGLGLLLGAPAGFLAARSYANSTMPTEGQARALTFGGMWGTWQGFGWAEVLKLGGSTVCDDFGNCYDTADDTQARVLSAIVGGVAGIGTGALLARKPITAGTAAAVTLSGFWGTWFGWGLSYVVGMDDEKLLGAALIGGNVALLGVGAVAPDWEVSENRARLVSVGGVIGALAGAGVMIILRPDNDRVAVAIPLAGSAIGLAAAASYTRDRTPLQDGGGSGDGAGALLNLHESRWSLDMPDAGLRMQRTERGLRPTAYVPLLRARF